MPNILVPSVSIDLLTSQLIILLILEQIERQPNGKILFTTRGKDLEGIQQVKVRNDQKSLFPKINAKLTNLGKILFPTRGREQVTIMVKVTYRVSHGEVNEVIWLC